mmetsp:Transcript_4748/g.5514  ORF Transcript_4748/g.5514 Transcript_4748/m.5514 type:complete len:102 (+) Transcript_4748:277-582(+)
MEREVLKEEEELEEYGKTLMSLKKPRLLHNHKIQMINSWFTSLFIPAIYIFTFTKLLEDFLKTFSGEILNGALIMNELFSINVLHHLQTLKLNKSTCPRNN